jgi:hypothetical protein
MLTLLHPEIKEEMVQEQIMVLEELMVVVVWLP